MKHPFLATLSAAFVLATGIFSLPAHADFVIDDEAAKPVVQPKAVVQSPPPVVRPYVAKTTLVPRSEGAPQSAGRVINIGSPAPGSALKGWADKVPLGIALDQVVPQDWKAEKRPGLNEAALVSWRGDRGWNSILEDLTRVVGFEAKIYWDEKRVVLSPVGTVQAAPVVRTTTFVAPAQPVTYVPAVKPLPSVQTWALDPNKTLKENVEAWAKQAGWNRVVWEASDYPIVAPATFQGDFASPTGPLATLISAYDRSEQPLLAKLSTRDRVINVSNKNYTPTLVEPSSPASLAPSSFKP